MKILLNIHHHSYTFSFLLVVVCMILFYPAFSIYLNTLPSTESLTISSNRTIISPGDVFELGFFKPASTPYWYLGIWYKKVIDKAYVWVANRDNPLTNSSGTLKISNLNLILLDQFNKTVWSTNLTTTDARSSLVAELLDNGNFVLRYSNNNDPGEFLWQSFDFPTDTLLPEMKLGRDLKTGLNRFLQSWKSSDDPSSWNFTYKLETQRGLPEFFLRANLYRMHRSGPWNGVQFGGIPEVLDLNYIAYSFTENMEEVSYTFLMTNHSIYSRLILDSDGALRRFMSIPPSLQWNEFWYSPADECDVFIKCGPYSYCDISTSPICNCLKGFNPKNPQQWDLRDGSNGCVRKTPLSCREDGFVHLKNMKLPDTEMAIVDRMIDVKNCEERCLMDCNCTSYAIADVRNGGSGCVFWTGKLIDIRNYAAKGQDLYVRLAASDLADLEGDRKGKIIRWSIGVSVMLIFIILMFFFWKRKQNRARATLTADQERNQELLMNRAVLSKKSDIYGESETENVELPLMEVEAIAMATENFSDCNKLGQGGFGAVYKGRLLNGQEIAVKRLSKTSTQGTNEFMNEVKLIARLQHINLVRLLGCCVDDGEKMLIYEYLENLSLDSHLFDETLSCKLDWQMRFDILNGIARGLLYLHQDSRCRIIHRDLKASNVLLDKDMTPKISDFGMARIFGRDEAEANTKKVVGTYGYMSPEYAMDGIFSTKSDVFSFGVLLIEIISGKRNRGFYNLTGDLNLLGCVWKNWEEGNGLETVDPIILESSPSTFRAHDILRCIQIGLLCVQERAEDRPMMSSIVLMLGSEAALIPQPTPPGYCIRRNPLESDLSTSKQLDNETCTVDQTPMYIIDAR